MEKLHLAMIGGVVVVAGIFLYLVLSHAVTGCALGRGPHLTDRAVSRLF